MANAVVIGAALLAGLGGCGGGCTDPSTTDDYCLDPVVGVADSVEIGLVDGTAFTPIVDDQIVDRVFGGQGFAMLGIGLRFRGPDVPTCIAQSTEVRNTVGDLVAGENQGVHTYAGTDGAYTTENMFMILGDVNAGERVTVTTTAAGQTVSRALFLDYAVDAGLPVDAGIDPDAGPLIDAALSDAAIPDAGPNGG